MQVMMMHIMDPFPLPTTTLPELPKKVERVILRMVEKETQDRYQSMAALRKALLALKPSESAISNVSGLFSDESMNLQLGKRKAGDTICPGCSSATYEGDRFCAQCGAKLVEDTDENEAEPSIMKRSKPVAEPPPKRVTKPIEISSEPEIEHGAWFLVVTNGGQTGKQTVLRNEMMLGRNESNDIWVNNNNASRRHALIQKRNNGFQIKDQGSTNGTWVNGKRIKRATRIKIGDQIVVGDTEFVVKRK